MTDAPAAVPGAAASPAVSAPGRVIGTFFSPVSTFESIAARPGYILPLLLWIAASLLVSAFMLPRMDYEGMTRARIEKTGQAVPEDRIQAQVAMQKRIAPKITLAIGALAALYSGSTTVFVNGAAGNLNPRRFPLQVAGGRRLATQLRPMVRRSSTSWNCKGPARAA